MKIEKKDKYVAPLTVVTRIEVEESFCASADIQAPEGQKVGQIDAHEVNESFTGGDFTVEGNNEWK